MQEFQSLNLQRENSLESLTMVAIQSLGESERKLIQGDLKFARDRMHVSALLLIDSALICAFESSSSRVGGDANSATHHIFSRW